MKRLVTIVVLILFGVGIASSQTPSLTRVFNYPPAKIDSILGGLTSIRGAAVGNDIDNDGKKEIAVTNYNYSGRVHIFEVVGNDSLQLVWSSPQLATGGGGSTPRYVLFGDLDNDGKGEIIFQSNAVGVQFFEWDGVNGSDNYGTQASAVLGTPLLANAGGNSEYFQITDVDGDNTPELLIAYNASTNATDKYYIVSALGDWSTNDPGFSSFNVEYAGTRTELGRWGLSAGSPVAMLPANLDGTGAKEVILHNWNLKNVATLRTTAVDTYALTDTTNYPTAVNYLLGGANDDVALFGGMTTDIDGDGREEVYLPTYPSPAGGPGAGKVHMIHYAPGSILAKIDSSNVVTLNTNSVTGTGDGFGIGYGDMDRDGKKEVYVSSGYGASVVSLEFQGGDKTDPSNWTTSLLYAGEADVYEALKITDSLGVIDTVKTINKPFASKIVAANTDIDGDGFEDIILPFQAINDSTTITRITWNSGESKWDTVITKVLNPKRWNPRVLEGTASTGVEAKDWTVILPEQYVLEQNYPNPFNPTTTIAFVLPIRNRVTVKIFDALGREVRTLIQNEEYPAGRSTVVWNGRSNAGQQVSSGTYFYSLIHGNFSKTQKMVLLK